MLCSETSVQLSTSEVNSGNLFSFSNIPVAKKSAVSTACPHQNFNKSFSARAAVPPAFPSRGWIWSCNHVFPAVAYTSHENEHERKIDKNQHLLLWGLKPGERGPSGG